MPWEPETAPTPATPTFEEELRSQLAQIARWAFEAREMAALACWLNAGGSLGNDLAEHNRAVAFLQQRYEESFTWPPSPSK